MDALSIRQRLENEAWFTTQRENVKNYDQISTPLKWAGILAFVIEYQNTHHGLSPTNLMIAKGANLSAGQIQYHLREMEKAGLIKDNWTANSKAHPRIITVISAVKVQGDAISETTPEKVTEAKTMDSEDIAVKKYGPGGHGPLGPTGRKDFMTRAKEVATAIIDHYDQHGYGPTGKYLKQKVYGVGDASKGGGLPRIVARMVALGWLHHAYKSQKYAVTGLGRAALFGQQNEMLHTDTPVNPAAPSSVYQEAGRARWDGVPAEERSELMRRASEARWSRERPTPTIPRPVSEPVIMAEVRRSQEVAPVEEPQQPVEQGFVSRSPLRLHEDVDLVIELTNRGFKVSR